MRNCLRILIVLVVGTLILTILCIKREFTYENLIRQNKGYSSIDGVKFVKTRTSETNYQQVYDRFLRHKNSSIEPNDHVKTILYWNKMYAEGETHFLFGKGDVFEGCPVPHCFATTQRDFHESVSEFDAVLFHGIEVELNDLPAERSPDQRYIFFTWESPDSRPINNYQFVSTPDYYNLTMSYRLDSDIVRPYGMVLDKFSNERIAPALHPHWRTPDDFFDERLLKLFNKKKKVAAWFVSHCPTISKREALTNELSKYFEIDVYGKCGNLRCNNTTEDCYSMLERDYFFYFSFENTICKDYVTEKLFSPMQKFVIPVVYGGVDYSDFAPPYSFIDVNYFRTIKDLADYLIRLSKNYEEYRKYFWWKKYYVVNETTKATVCKLCEVLHDKSLPPKILKDFNNYYSFDQCRKF